MKAYKLFKVKNGKLYPLYVLSNKEIPIGVWLQAECGELTESGKVKAGSLNKLAYRPGFHSSFIPYCNHIYTKGKNGERYMKKNTIWCEIEISDKINYQEEANNNGINKKGKLIHKFACLKKIPKNGYYEYKTSPSMPFPWFISGEMKVNRILSDREVKEICNKNGYEPLRRINEEKEPKLYY